MELHNVRVKFRDGRRLYGPLWEWRPEDGFFSLVDSYNENDGNLIIVRLDDCAEAVEERVQVAWNKVMDVDLLERARRDLGERRQQP